MLSERIDHNIWVSVDGELQQLRPLVAQLQPTRSGDPAVDGKDGQPTYLYSATCKGLGCPQGRWMMDKINMRCPSCTGKAIFIGTGGYLTCSHIDCPEPDVARKVKQLEAEKAQAGASLDEYNRMYAKLEAENQRLRELITRSCYYTVEPTEGNLAIFAAVHLLAWNERTEPKVLFDECSDEWIDDALKED